MSGLSIVLQDKTEILIDELDFPAHVIKKFNSKEEMIVIWNKFTPENLQEVQVFKNSSPAVKLIGLTLEGVQSNINADGTMTTHFYMQECAVEGAVPGISEEDREYIEAGRILLGEA